MSCWSDKSVAGSRLPVPFGLFLHGGFRFAVWAGMWEEDGGDEERSLGPTM